MLHTALLVLLSLLWIAPEASAQTPSSDGCAGAALAWTARCNATEHAAISQLECPAPGLYLLVTPHARVELSFGSERGFRRAGPWGLSLVNANGDWASLAAPTRDSFERVVRCVTSDATLPTDDSTHGSNGSMRGPQGQDAQGAGRGDGARASGDRRRSTGRDPHVAGRFFPWQAILAAALLLAAWWPHRARRGSGLRGRALAVVAASLAAMLARWWVFGPNFFHQNGQGPMWVDSAASGWLPYGDGFPQVFNLAVRLHPQAPDLAVFAAQGLLSGLALCAAWSLMRRCAAPSDAAAPLASALALVLLVQPALGRAAVSESYFAAGLSLQLLAAWALSHGHLPGGSGSAKLRALAPTVAGGLLLSLALGVHPVTWVPAALVPLVLLATPGSLRHRVRRMLLAYAVVGAVVLVAAGPGVLAVLRGELGQRWAHAPHVNHAVVRRALALSAAAVLVLTVLARRPLRALPRLLVVVGLAALVPLTDVVTPSGTREHVGYAFAWLYAPVALACLAAALRDIPRSRGQAWALVVGVAIAGGVWSSQNFRAQTMRPTDDLELRALLAWRERIPAGHTVAWLSRAGDHILAFPLYPTTDPLRRRLMALSARDPLPSLATDGRTLWYRSSVCTTAEGRDYCAQVERNLTLEPVATAVLPARWSLARLVFDRASVPVGLYRVRASRAP